jgi:glycosyltransferase involved in cell wall biosynthesis
VVGPAPPLEVRELAHHPGIEVTGRVEDVRPYLARAALVVLPLRAGAGTKLRIFTAMAMQKVVLASPVAAEGIEAAPEEEIVISDGAEPFAEAAIALLLDGSRRSRIGRAARARAVAQYDWRVIGHRLEEFYTSLLDRGAA